MAHEAGLNWEVEQLVWWVVGSQLTLVDASWTLSQLHRVQAALAAGVYTEEETAELLHSLTLYIQCQLKRLRALHTTFPVNSATTQHQSQLTYTLRLGDDIFPVFVCRMKHYVCLYVTCMYICNIVNLSVFT